MIKIYNNESQRQYSKIARYFTYAKFISLILTVLFVLFAFNFYRDDITIENFRYMIKYMDFEAPDSSATLGKTSISFDGNSAAGLALYRNSIAVLKRTGLELYDPAGQKIFSSQYTMTSPTAISSNKYMLVYDTGGYSAAVFNSFSKVWETTFEYPIVDAEINDRGDFLIVTSEKGYTSAVYVYNSDFKQVYRWLSGDKYVIDAALSTDEQDKFIISTLRAQDGLYLSEMILLSTKSEERIASFLLYDQMALEISDFSDTATLLTDNAMTFIDCKSMEKLSSVSFARDSLQHFCHNEKYSVLVLSKKIIGSENEIAVYSADGKHINTFYSQGHINDVCISDDYLYQLTSGQLTVYNLDTFETDTIEVDKRYSSLLSGQSTVLMAGTDNAVTLKGE